MTDLELAHKNPFVIISWSVIEPMLDPNNIYDKILLATKKMSELKINSFQCWGKPCKMLNSLFGLDPEKYKSCEYGVQSVWVSGYDFAGHSARLPRIHIEYQKGDWRNTYHVILATESLPEKKKSGEYYRHATKQEEQKIYEYLLALIADREAEIERASNNMSLEEFSDLCLKYAPKELKGTKYHAELQHGKSAKDSRESTAIVIGTGKMNDIFSQAGYIKVSQNKFKEFGLECTALGCGGYNDDCKDIDCLEYKIRGMVHYLIN